jgi:calmodulin
MISLGFESKNGAIFQMISDLDADGNGNIDFDEWYSLLTKRTNDKDSRANINKIFALFDPDHHGKIDASNLKIVAA